MAGVRTKYVYPQARYLLMGTDADRPRQGENTFRGQVVGDTTVPMRKQATSSPALILGAGSRLWPQVEH